MLDKSKLVKKSTSSKSLDFEDFVMKLKSLGFVLIHSIVNHPHLEESDTVKFKGKKMPDIGNNRGWQFIKVDIDDSDKPVGDTTRQKVTMGNNIYARALLHANLESEVYFVNADIETEFAEHESDKLDAIFKIEKKEYKKQLKKLKAQAKTEPEPKAKSDSKTVTA